MKNMTCFFTLNWLKNNPNNWQQWIVLSKIDWDFVRRIWWNSRHVSKLICPLIYSLYYHVIVMKGTWSLIVSLTQARNFFLSILVVETKVSYQESNVPNKCFLTLAESLFSIVLWIRNGYLFMLYQSKSSFLHKNLI